MKAADWIGVAVLGTALVVGGFIVVRELKSGQFGGTLLPGGPKQPNYVAPVAQPALSDHTSADILAGTAAAGQIAKSVADIFSSISHDF